MTAPTTLPAVIHLNPATGDHLFIQVGGYAFLVHDGMAVVGAPMHTFGPATEYTAAAVLGRLREIAAEREEEE